MNLTLAEARLMDGVGGRWERHLNHRRGTHRGGGLRGKSAGDGRFHADRLPGKDGHARADRYPPACERREVVSGVDDYRVSRRMDEHLAMHAYRTLEAAQRALRSGFPTLRDMSSRDFVDVQLRKPVSEGLVVAPRIICRNV